MAAFWYCTPEWLEESARAYRSDPSFEQTLKNLSLKVCFRVEAEPSWGIDRDILFCCFLEAGKLIKLGFFSEDDARRQADYILSAATEQWKSILRKESGFTRAFMAGRIKLEMGSRLGVLKLAPYAGAVVDALTRVDIQFPDEMSDEELPKYKSYMREFRVKLGV